jgi:hypothetical protein
MKADKNDRKQDCQKGSKYTGIEIHDATSRASGHDHPEKVYFVNTKHLRVSSTKNWDRTIDQLRKQIRNGSKINGVLQDHCF